MAWFFSNFEGKTNCWSIIIFKIVNMFFLKKPDYFLLIRYTYYVSIFVFGLGISCSEFKTPAHVCKLYYQANFFFSYKRVKIVTNLILLLKKTEWPTYGKKGAG